MEGPKKTGHGTWKAGEEEYGSISQINVTKVLVLKNGKLGGEKKAQQIRALVALAEHLGLVSTTPMVDHNHS